MYVLSQENGNFAFGEKKRIYILGASKKKIWDLYCLLLYTVRKSTRDHVEQVDNIHIETLVHLNRFWFLVSSIIAGFIFFLKGNSKKKNVLLLPILS